MEKSISRVQVPEPVWAHNPLLLSMGIWKASEQPRL